MKHNEITDIRIKIIEAKVIAETTHYPDEKILAGYLAKQLKAKLLNLMFPQPKEL